MTGLDWHHQQCIVQEVSITMDEMRRPSVLFRPTLRRPAGGDWEVVLDNHLIAYGTTPDEAMRNFDKIWSGK